MPLELTEGAIESIVSGGQCDEPLIQIVGTKLISGGSGGSDRYRLLLSDGKHSYSHAMLATQLNTKMASGEMDNHCVVRVKQYICNTLQGDRRVMILLDVDVIAKGLEIGGRLGNPQPFKAGQASENIAPTNNQAPASKNIPNGVAKTNSAPGIGSHNVKTRYEKGEVKSKDESVVLDLVYDYEKDFDSSQYIFDKFDPSKLCKSCSEYKGNDQLPSKVDDKIPSFGNKYSTAASGIKSKQSNLNKFELKHESENSKVYVPKCLPVKVKNWPEDVLVKKAFLIVCGAFNDYT